MVKIVRYDYNPAMSDSKEVWGENYKEYEVGKNGVKQINHRRSEWSGDLTDVQVLFEDGDEIIIFHPHMLICSS